ncbi:MAG: hypothetical protein JNM49_01370 [Flavobacteriales bacterium]|nr:hypothetical protein [Flavobacteriales bacterium]
MDDLKRFHDYFYYTLELGDAFYYAVGFVAAIAILAQWRLYEKCRQPGLAAFVPIWNVIVFMRIVGRPDRDAWKMLIPIYGQLYFIPKVWIEVVQCFGKRSIMDYILVLALNGLYILNLALSNDQYLGPLRGQAPLPKAHKVGGARPQLA